MTLAQHERDAAAALHTHDKFDDDACSGAGAAEALDLLEALNERKREGLQTLTAGAEADDGAGAAAEADDGAGAAADGYGVPRMLEMQQRTKGLFRR
jgi:hypothetical protein